MRNLGLLGESFFSAWCSSVGITFNASFVDRTGWDFFLEFPSNTKNNLPRDMQPAPIECKVQVKSTDNRKRKLPIEVSNLDRLIRSQMPTFFCFIEFDGKNEPQATYLVHIGKEIIEKTLKRIRELESKGKGNELNKSTITIHYGVNDRLEYNTGDCLKLAIEKHIPDSIDNYVKNKSELVNGIGFEKGKFQLTVTMSGKDPVKEIVDLSLGLCEEIDIDEIIHKHTRFGILSNQTSFNSEGVKLSILAQPRKCKLKLKDYKYSSGITFSADFYFSPFNHFTSQEYIKFRIVSKFFEFVCEPYQNKTNILYNPRFEERHSLTDLINLFNVLTTLQKSSLIVEVEPEGLLPLVIVQLNPTEISYIPINIKNEVYDCSRIYQIIKIVGFICRDFNIPEEKVLVSIREIIRFSKMIENFNQILYSEIPKKIQIDFYTNYIFPSGSEIVITSSIVSYIGNYTIICFFGLRGFPYLLSGQTYRLIADNIILGPKISLDEDSNIEQERIDEIFDEFEGKLKEQGLVTFRLIDNDVDASEQNLNNISQTNYQALQSISDKKNEVIKPTPHKEPRPFGLCAGEFTVPNDFNEPLPENILSSFEPD